MNSSFKSYRWETNPKEKEFHDKFLKEHINNKHLTVDLLVFKPANEQQSHAVDTLSEREKNIMLSTIQWLGSTVGTYFLESCGFVKKEKI